MKKVLIITYYWPPSGGAGVQRWLRFVKNLRNFGWEPIVYTTENPIYASYDENLISEIPQKIQTFKHRIKEPNNFLGNLFFWKKSKNSIIYQNQQQKGEKRSITQKLLWFIRGNFFIPDSRFLWIKPSVKYLSNVLSENKYDLIISTGPPHSLHLIGKALNLKFKIPWIADFRDPWTSMDYLQEMFLTKFAWNKHKRFEKSVIESANEIIVVGQTMFNEFKEKYDKNSVIIYNGYNELPKEIPSNGLDEKFTIVHVGSFLKKRNCDDLWEVLFELTKDNKSFSENLEIKLVGGIAPDVIESIKRYKLDVCLNKIDYVPYQKTLVILNSAQVLLLPIDRISNAEFVLTGKLFEYLKAKRPILNIGPTNGDAAEIIKNCNAGYCCSFNDKEQIKRSVLEMYELFLQGKNIINSINVEQYSSYELTKQLAQLFNKTIQIA